MREAIGEGLPTRALPRAFAHADLRDVVAWRNRIEAAERLARSGAVPPTVLFAAYAEQDPAASGGVWDRAEAIQRLDRAIGEDAGAVAETLPAAWEAMVTAGTEVAFGAEYGETLAAVPLDGTAGRIAYLAGLLGPAYEAVALARRHRFSRKFHYIIARANARRASRRAASHAARSPFPLHTPSRIAAPP